MEQIEKNIIEALKNTPYGRNNLYESDVIGLLKLDGEKVTLEVTFPETGNDDELSTLISTALKKVKGIKEVAVKPVNRMKQPPPEELPPQSPKTATTNAAPTRNQYLSNYKHVVAVASGKGGVGKSTVALNVACALKNMGKTVSMFDADIYGPSLPLMIGERTGKAKVVGNQIMPMSRYGIEYMSIGNLVDEGTSVIWRGPMVHQAIDQILRDTVWPGGDYMIIDLPPGTGDVQITLSQVTALSGAVIVCTPQDVALIDAMKAISMFQKVNVPIIGMIENMSSFICPKCSAETPIFGVGGCEKESNLNDFNFLGRIPIDLETRVCGDNGKPMLKKITPRPAPKDIRFGNKLTIVWNNGPEKHYDYFQLRYYCPCAACVDELTGIRTILPEDIPVGIKPLTGEFVGNYALRIRWSDGHATGIIRSSVCTIIIPQ
ncbi:hypothetical protein CHS0354_035215 [Potamilus streckersoni]|uniref:Gamma-butyrobetaine hydroxylase-like N-terminal domain-containing protein n=1 Tax=Potamilus streckersoni TaxID=2493646 RepID=A0AAE0S2P3_9BIVA|nr:hypothetical protein CHS0354_035215 [Potamilus streckersoni]